LAVRVPKTRLLTALVLLALVLALVCYGSLPWVGGVFALVALRAGWEWAALCPGLSGVRRAVLVVVLGLALAGLWAALPAGGLVALLWAALAWWALALVLVRQFPATPRVLDAPAAQAAIIVLALAAAWLALVQVAAGARSVLLLCLAIVWVADSAAYLVGRRYGRRRLCPRVSPGKTVEGVVGGLGGAALAGLVAGLAWQLGGLRTLALIVLTTACAGVSVIGDLAESLFKRRAGVKDSSHLLPGHGGVLDRIDALIAAAPLFALTVPWLLRG
jgi:phosphatidate cytidylyltransferase